MKGNPWLKCYIAPEKYAGKKALCGCTSDKHSTCKDRWHRDRDIFKSEDEAQKDQEAPGNVIATHFELPCQV